MVVPNNASFICGPQCPQMARMMPLVLNHIINHRLSGAIYRGILKWWFFAQMVIHDLDDLGYPHDLGKPSYTLHIYIYSNYIQWFPNDIGNPYMKRAGYTISPYFWLAKLLWNTNKSTQFWGPSHRWVPFGLMLSLQVVNEKQQILGKNFGRNTMKMGSKLPGGPWEYTTISTIVWWVTWRLNCGKWCPTCFNYPE